MKEIKQIDKGFLEELNRVIESSITSRITYFTEIREYVKLHTKISKSFEENGKHLVALQNGDVIPLINIESVNEFRAEGDVFDGLSCACD